MSLTTAIASIVATLPSFFAALRGPDPTDFDFDFDDVSIPTSPNNDDAPVPAQIRVLRATNTAHRHRIFTLELDLLYFQQRNAALHAREQVFQRDIAETLALADKLAKPRPDHVFVPERLVEEAVREAVSQWKAQCATVVEKDARFDAEARAWQEKYAALNAQVSALVEENQQKIRDVDEATSQSNSEVQRLRREHAALKAALGSALKSHAACEAVLERGRDGMEEWKMAVKKETWAWQAKFTDKTRSEQADKYAVEHGEQIEKVVRERYVALIKERDSAAEARERLEGELEKLKQDLEGEQLLHRIAVDVTQRLQGELEDEKDNYELLHIEFLRVKGEAVRSREAYSELSGVYTAKLWEVHRLQEENLRASKEEKQAYEVLTAAHLHMLKAFQNGEAMAAKTQSMVIEMRDQLLTVKAHMNTSKGQCDEPRQREEFLKKKLLHLKGDLDAMLEKLVVVSGQRKEALEGQREALKMVDKLRNGEVLDDGKEIGIFGEDEEVVSGTREGSDSEGQEDDGFEATGLESTNRDENKETDGEDLDGVTILGTEDAEDDGYAVRGEDERQVDAEYEDVSQGDASDAEEWRL
ncbi:hypothetical protein PSPO01_02136 [Paraphaeosphaeria sporulosa]